MIAYDQAAAWKPTRDETRSIVCTLNALGVSLALSSGRIAARPDIALVQRDGCIIPQKITSIPEEARELLREYREAILEYLTTPPEDTRPCAACGRSVLWVLDPVGIWVCDCYYHPELHTWPEIKTDQAALSIVTQEQKSPAAARVTLQLLTESDQAAPVGSQNGREMESLPPAGRYVRETLKTAPGERNHAQNGHRTGHTGQENSQERAAARPSSTQKRTQDRREWRKRHGVLTDTCLLFFHGDEIKVIDIPPVTSLDDLLNTCADHRIDTLWIQPGCNYARWPADETPASSWDVKASTFEPEKGVKILRNLSARSGKVWISLTWPEWTSYEWNTRWLGQLPTGETMLYALRYLSVAFEQEVNHNPGVMGRELMKRLNSTERRAAWVECPAIDFETLPRWPGEGYHYKQLIEDPEEFLAIWKVQHRITGPVYLHSWDKNSQYPAASSSVILPCGTPEHVTSEIETYLTNEKGQWKPRAGYWHIGEIHPNMGTPLYELNPIEDGQEWVSTPMLTLLHNQGIELTISEAYIWPENHAWLDTFGPAFWNARQSLKTDPEAFPHEQGQILAYHSAKRIGAAAIGLLNSLDSVKYHRQWYRPDAWRFIIEEARAKLFFNVSKVYQDHGEYPLMIATDAVYYLSGEQDAARVFPGCFARSEELGGWKHEFTLEVTPEILSCFDPEFSTGKTIVELRKYR